MKLDIDKVQMVSYLNAKRRGFYKSNFDVSESLNHLKSEVRELADEVLTKSEEGIKLEAGDVMLNTLSLLYHLDIKATDAIISAIHKELGKESK